MFVGDSKTYPFSPFSNTWPQSVCSAVSTAQGGRPLTCAQHGTPGSTVMGWASSITPTIDTHPTQQASVMVGVQLGVNDIYFGTGSEATWKTHYLAIIDAITSRWPCAQVYLAYPWLRGYDSDAATVHGWIDDIIAARPGVAFAGPDEAVWLKGGDNGVTNTTDGIHISAAGQTAATAAWLAAMGY